MKRSIALLLLCLCCHGCQDVLFSCVLRQNRRQIAQTQVKDLEHALSLYRFDTARVPTTEDGLEALIQDPGVEGWKGPYLSRGKVPNDPWKRPYHYRWPGIHGEYDIWSYGEDGVEGGEGMAGDVVSWQR